MTLGNDHGGAWLERKRSGGVRTFMPHFHRPLPTNPHLKIWSKLYFSILPNHGFDTKTSIAGNDLFYNRLWYILHPRMAQSWKAAPLTRYWRNGSDLDLKGILRFLRSPQEAVVKFTMVTIRVLGTRVCINASSCLVAFFLFLSAVYVYGRHELRLCRPSSRTDNICIMYRTDAAPSRCHGKEV